MNKTCFECKGRGLIADGFILSIWKNPNLTDVQKIEQSNRYYKDNPEEWQEYTCYVCQGSGIIPEDSNKCLWRAISSLERRIKVLEVQNDNIISDGVLEAKNRRGQSLKDSVNFLISQIHMLRSEIENKEDAR